MLFGENAKMANRFNLPFIGFGMGLRTVHYAHIMEHWPKVDWFEIISENFMDSQGLPRQKLEAIAEHYPIVMHGVSLSIGSTDPLDKAYLKKIKALAGWLNPPWISDHLCWTGAHGKNSHDLLPVPYTEEALQHVIDRIKQVQDTLGRPILMENPSTYLEFTDSTMPEWEFIARMAEGADCGLLLDANNVYVTCYNHKYDPKEYVDAIPADRVVQVHLAGHDNNGTHIIDTHGGEVIDHVWNIYRYILSRTGKVSTMVEWDQDIPEFDVVMKEVEKAKQYAEEATTPNNIISFDAVERTPAEKPETYTTHLDVMLDAVVMNDVETAKPEKWIPAKPDFSSSEQLEVYTNAYHYRLFDVVWDDYPVLAAYLGEDNMEEVVHAFVRSTLSEHYSLSPYTRKLTEWLETAEVGKVFKKKDRAVAIDLARLESALDEVQADLPDSAPFSPEQLQVTSPEDFMALQLPVRTASFLLAFDHTVNEYLTAVKHEETPKEVRRETNYLLVFRDEEDIWRMPLEKEEFYLLSALKEGKPIGEAIMAAVEHTEADEEALMGKFQTWFANWTQHRVLAAI
jgi:hypothetical protein